jgi:hypothetical protein
MQGMKDWAEVMKTAEDVVLRGDVQALLHHSDRSGIPADDLAKIERLLGQWKGMSGSGMRLESTKVMTPGEFEAANAVEDLDLPIELRDRTKNRSQWNIPPEKIIVFRFTAPDTVDVKGAMVKFTVGAFQRDGQWYFAAKY